MSAGSSDRPFRTNERSARTYATDDGMKRVNPDSLVAKFEATRSTDRHADYLPVLDLPGTGTQRSDCGDEIPRFCADCGATSSVGRTCYAWTCPRCWRGAARKRATTITAKLEALRRYREASEGPGWRGWKFHHLVLSPPDGYRLDADDPLAVTFDLLKEVLGEIGADTGVLVYHPFRGEDGDDRGFWKDVLADGSSLDMDALREDAVTFSPHFHALVLAKHVPTAQFVGPVEEATGWVVNRITKADSDVSLYDLYDLGRAASYCLSHAGVTDGANQYRYFGEVANFAATSAIEREADAVVRSVSVNTLGLPYDDVSCAVERIKTETTTIERPAEKINLGRAHGAGGDVPMEEVEIEQEVEGRCDGRLLEIKNAPAFLTDGDWRAAAEHADQLAAAWREWRERIDGDPDERPPDPGG